jgi:hypothetical protein
MWMQLSTACSQKVFIAEGGFLDKSFPNFAQIGKMFYNFRQCSRVLDYSLTIISMMETKHIFKTSVFNATLTRLIAREDFGAAVEISSVTLSC